MRIFDKIAEEFSRTEHAILAITNQKTLLEREPVLAKSVQLRNPYIDPLNYIQVEMIRRLRGMENKQGAEADALRGVIELTINGGERRPEEYGLRAPYFPSGAFFLLEAQRLEHPPDAGIGGTELPRHPRTGRQPRKSFPPAPG